jgi:glycosyltransferase involved in cell wall biosynthesis
MDLLNSIDYFGGCEIEINICDDFSPRLDDIKDVISSYSKNTGRTIFFAQHNANLGYDVTLYDLIEMASGDWIVFMGDDDFFVPGALEKYIQFLIHNQDKDLGYVMKSHYNITATGHKEYFRYFRDDQFYQPGPDSYITLFRKSVFISGFLIKTELAKKFNTHDLDGTLLLQLYLLARVCLLHPTAYHAEFFTYQYTYNIYEKDEVMYDRNKKEFVKRVPTVDISLNFLASYLKVIDYVDAQCNLNVRNRILLDISKYSYPSLAIQRHLGVYKFTQYCLSLHRLGFAASKYFYIYYFLLIALGQKWSDKLIYGLRNKLGVTPIL